MDERERLLDRVLVTLEPKGPTDRPVEVLPHDPRLRAFPIETMTILRMAMEADLRGWRSPQSADAV
jgi:hypothetical protein